MEQDKADAALTDTVHTTAEDLARSRASGDAAAIDTGDTRSPVTTTEGTNEPTSQLDPRTQRRLERVEKVSSDRLVQIAQRGLKSANSLTAAEIKSLCASVLSQSVR